MLLRHENTAPAECVLILITLVTSGRLVEITERTGASCGGSFVDCEFVKFLDAKLGGNVMERFKQENYHHYQYLCEYFARKVKFGFTGDRTKYATYELDLLMVCQPIRRYVEGPKAAELDEVDWIVEFDFDDVKAMF